MVARVDHGKLGQPENNWLCEKVSENVSKYYEDLHKMQLRFKQDCCRI